MTRRIIAAALSIAAVFLCGCSNQNHPEPTPAATPTAAAVATPTPSPTPEPFAALRDAILAEADAEVTEAEGALLITLNVTGTDEAQAAEAFFEQAGGIFTRILHDAPYSGVEFTMNVNGEAVGSFFVMKDESGMIALPPAAYDTAYADALQDAFLSSGFSYAAEG